MVFIGKVTDPRAVRRASDRLEAEGRGLSLTFRTARGSVTFPTKDQDGVLYSLLAPPPSSIIRQINIILTYK